MNTIIIKAEEAANRYFSVMLETIICNASRNNLLDNAKELIQLGEDIKNLLSPVSSFNAFLEEFRTGMTMCFLTSEEGKKLQDLDDRNENFQIVVFRANGQPVGLYGKDVLCW